MSRHTKSFAINVETGVEDCSQIRQALLGKVIRACVQTWAAKRRHKGAFGLMDSKRFLIRDCPPAHHYLIQSLSIPTLALM